MVEDSNTASKQTEENPQSEGDCEGEIIADESQSETDDKAVASTGKDERKAAVDVSKVPFESVGVDTEDDLKTKVPPPTLLSRGTPVQSGGSQPGAFSIGEPRPNASESDSTTQAISQEASDNEYEPRQDPISAELVQIPGNDLPTATPSVPMVSAKPVPKSKRLRTLVALIILLVIFITGLAVGLGPRNETDVVAVPLIRQPRLPPATDRNFTSSTVAAIWQANTGCASATSSDLEISCPPRSSLEILAMKNQTGCELVNQHQAMCRHNFTTSSPKPVNSIVYFSCHRPDSEGSEPVVARVIANESCKGNRTYSQANNNTSPTEDVVLNVVSLVHFCIDSIRFTNDPDSITFRPRGETNFLFGRRRLRNTRGLEPLPSNDGDEATIVTFRDSWRANGCTIGKPESVRAGETLQEPRRLTACYTASTVDDELDAATYLSDEVICRHRRDQFPNLLDMQRNVSLFDDPEITIETILVDLEETYGSGNSSDDAAMDKQDDSSSHAVLWQTDVGCTFGSVSTLRVDCPRASEMRLWNKTNDVTCQDPETAMASYTMCTRNTTGYPKYWNSIVYFTCTRSLLENGDDVRATVIPVKPTESSNLENCTLQAPISFVSLVHYCNSSATSSTVLGNGGNGNTTVVAVNSTGVLPHKLFKGIWRSNRCETGTKEVRITTGDIRKPRTADLCYQNQTSFVATYIPDSVVCRHRNRFGPNLQNLYDGVKRFNKYVIMGTGVENVTLGIPSDLVSEVPDKIDV